MAAVIDSFRDEYYFLSNFWPCWITLDRAYPSVEHAYVAMKTTDKWQRAEVASIATPGEAKRYGKKLPLRPGWDDLRLEIMLHLVRLKFAEPTLTSRLLQTGDATLIEGNTHGDRYWGAVNGTGLNQLGRILMQVRAECAQRGAVTWL